MSSARRPPPAPGTIEYVQALALRLAGVAAVVTYLLGLYAHSLALPRTAIPLRSADGRLFWLLSLAAVTAFGVAVRRISGGRLRSDEVARRRPERLAAGAGLLPALVVFACLQLVAWDSRVAIVVTVPILAGVGVFTAIVVRDYLLSGDPAVYSGARLVHTVLTIGVAFLSLSLARGWMGGAVYTFAVIYVIAALLLYQAFDGVRVFPIRRVAYALAGGAVLAETAVALNYWPPSGWYGGAILAVVFAVVTLSIEAVLLRRISTDLVTRYVGAGVGVCGLLMFLAR